MGATGVHPVWRHSLYFPLWLRILFSLPLQISQTSPPSAFVQTFRIIFTLQDCTSYISMCWLPPRSAKEVPQPVITLVPIWDVGNGSSDRMVLEVDSSELVTAGKVRRFIQLTESAVCLTVSSQGRQLKACTSSTLEKNLWEDMDQKLSASTAKRYAWTARTLSGIMEGPEKLQQSLREPLKLNSMTS